VLFWILIAFIPIDDGQEPEHFRLKISPSDASAVTSRGGGKPCPGSARSP